MIKNILNLENSKKITRNEQSLIHGGFLSTTEGLGDCRKKCEKEFRDDGNYPKYMNCMVDCVPGV